ncbi:MAG: glycosyltransferase family 39 protein [Bacteroidales bacterium]|nr:glycosyltransferase family 39 protein [Bacteroidales bacterium]
MDKLIIKRIYRYFNSIPHIWIVFILMAYGIGVRIMNYISNRALWLDESMLSLNIVNRSYAELLEPLDYRQVAPIGFLMVEKFFTELIGPNEYALRLFPLMAGIASVILFYLVVREYSGKAVAILGLILFIFSHWLIYYSVEVKQYHLDVLIFLLSIKFIYKSLENDLSLKKFILFGILGALMIWFSNITVIVLFSIGLGLLPRILRLKTLRYYLGIFLMIFFWLTSFACYYYFFIGKHPSAESQVSSFIYLDYLPDTSSFQTMITWIKDKFHNIFVFFLGHRSFKLGIILSIIGLVLIIIKREYKLIIFIVPLMVHLVLSLLHIYPFSARFTLYIAPAVFIFISYGIYHIFGSFRYKTILIIPVMVFIVFQHASHSHKPIKVQEIREPMQYINSHYKNGDIIYVHGGSIYAFKFYKASFILPDREYIDGIWIGNDFDRFDADLQKISVYNRVWILLSHCSQDEKEYMISKCEETGRIADRYEHINSAAILYEPDSITE